MRAFFISSSTKYQTFIHNTWNTGFWLVAHCLSELFFAERTWQLVKEEPRLSFTTALMSSRLYPSSLVLVPLDS